MKDFLVLQIILGPLFIIGTVGISMFGSSSIGLLLFITHILASVTVGFLFRFWKRKNTDKLEYISNVKKPNSISSKKNISFSNLGEVIASSLSNATSTILMIGGFVIIFSVLISIFKASKILHIFTFIFSPCFKFLNIPTKFVSPFITGILEITNGISMIANTPEKLISLNIILVSFLLGVGGISIFLQVFSITSKTDLSIKPYIIGKVLQGFISSFYTFLFIQCFPAFNLNL